VEVGFLLWNSKERERSRLLGVKMAAFLQKNRSIDAQMRLLVPKRVTEDDKLVDYGAFLLDRFLNVLESLHGKELKETVHEIRFLLLLDCLRS